MSITYLRVKRQAALRLAQVSGYDANSLETNYAGSWATMLDGAEIPLTGFKDAILAVEKELAQDIGNNAQHPARSFLYGRSANLADLASTPTVDNASKEFVGIFDSCADATSSKPCTWMPTQVITDLIDNAQTYFGSNFYYYNINGNFIRHTRTNVFLQGCVWDYTTQSTAYDNASGTSPLPQALETVWLDGVAARAAQVGWVEDKTGYYAQMYAQGREMFSSATGGNIPLASAANVVSG